MATDSRKREDFLNHPIVDKSVRKVPGIGDKSGEMLENAKYDTADKLLGRYVAAGRKEFIRWLESKPIEAKSKRAIECADALDEWQETHVFQNQAGNNSFLR